MPELGLREAAPHGGGALGGLAEAALLMRARVSLLPRAAQGPVLGVLARVQLVFMAGAAAVLARPSIVTATAWASSPTATTIAVTGMADVVICPAAR